PKDTLNAPSFADVFPDIASRLHFNRIVAHNESFDRRVLKQSMEYYGLGDNRVNVDIPWECTMKIYRKKGFRPYRLNACCSALDIELNHHDALSDALGCAKLYLFHLLDISNKSSR
ncbi:MAG TPA: exonuclease domain-containing protein, partial [Salinivirgaceae bacterium]|nr:exonuclease domain-containing protein [Salinivirgaceae bacterium]